MESGAERRNNIREDTKMWKEKLRLSPDESLKHERSYEKGSLGQEEVSLYLIISSNGEEMGSVQFTEHIAIRGFRRSFHLVQRDKARNPIIDVRWSE